MSTAPRVAPAYTVAEGILVRNVGTESVILNLRSETYLGLNATGSRMWEVLTESASVEAAYQKLCTEYDIVPTTLWRDMQDFIETLVAYGLLIVSPTAHPE